ncbi:MAG: replicative DNA helicase [Bacteroidetes bacterium MED-G17]|nr:MAG: replicative DNA helicase [Bacteroidetes bacterium TMED39]PDH51989.1 MAG: replicative DNA helicase [Bacteroidetes bacterium MED-G17]|tara:strand:- start:1533 stop:3047 length:1515 start_codon:yes stop_codon:yes gene_type:complete
MNQEFKIQNSFREKDKKKFLDLGGKIPPQALELEEAVLGALMLEKNAAERVMDLLHPNCFYSDKHKVVFEAIKKLFADGEPIDLLTVKNQLAKNGTLEMAGGSVSIARLTNKVASAANLEFHSHLLIEKFIQRSLIQVSTEIGKEAYEETNDAFQLLDNAEKRLYAIKDESLKKNFNSIDDLVAKAIEQIESAKSSSDTITGVPTGFNSLDKITNGFQKSDLIILAGRPGMGKTAFALTAARNAAVMFNKPVAVFSLEMSAVQLVTRLISGEVELSGEKLRQGNLSEFEMEQLLHKMNALSQANIFIDDTPQLTIFDLKAKARRLKQQKNIELIVIDYLQLMRSDEGSAKNREQEISHISRSLKGLAKELDIPIIALAQLSRAVEQRPDKKPILSDLRESGSIEQDADIVGFIYRPEYYGITQDEEGNSMEGIASVDIAKHRNGATKSAFVRFKKEYAKFENLDIISYEDGQSITVGSKLNDENYNINDDFGENKEDDFSKPPF